MTEFAITLTDGSVWLAIGVGLLFGAVSLTFGIALARIVGLLESDAAAGETLGIGLGCGLLVLAAWWAAIASGGRSSFTSVAIGFAIAVVLGIARRARPRPDNFSASTGPDERALGRIAAFSLNSRSSVPTFLAAGAFVVLVALLYGLTMAPSPRDGVQPVEFNDSAYYSVLGADLAATGIETTYSPSGFSDIPGVPPQMWYHWGEIWLASAVIKIFGTAPIAARFFAVLPVILLAAAALTGTVVRRMTGSGSRRAYLLGFLVCLFLAPISFTPGPFFSSWAVGMIFGVTIYGMAAVAVLMGLYCVSVLGSREATWALTTFVGSAVAAILPAHLVIALLVILGVGSVWVLRIVRSVMETRRPPTIPLVWRRTLIVTGVSIVATIWWGFMTGHGFGPSAPPYVPPFNDAWRDSVAITVLGSGAFFAIPVVWFLIRRQASLLADTCLGTGVVLVIGAIVWGARLRDFTTFYFLYAGIAVIATPVAAVALWTLLTRLRQAKRVRLAVACAVLCVIQLEAGIVTGIGMMRQFGAHYEAPVSVTVLTRIRQLPLDAKLAYACNQLDEAGFVGSQLLSIDAHTARRVVPMCFEAEVLDRLIGLPLSVPVENAFFKWAPQRVLYPDATAKPSSDEVATFLKTNGIDYIYADEKHPNTLVANAVPIATSGNGQVLRIP